MSRLVEVLSRKRGTPEWDVVLRATGVLALLAIYPAVRYSVRKFLFATFLGRGPRVWFFAALGLVVPVATRTLVTYVIAAMAVGVILATYQRHRTTLARAGRTGALTPGTGHLTPDPAVVCRSGAW